MGFLVKWIFRALLAWAAVVAVQSCGNLKVYSDDVPATPAPASARGQAGGA